MFRRDGGETRSGNIELFEMRSGEEIVRVRRKAKTRTTPSKHADVIT
jgi:hypothetical protein